MTQVLDPLYHVARAAEFDDTAELYEPAGFIEEGFVRCCSLAQLGGVLTRDFAGAGDLVLLEFDPGEIEAEIRWEYVARHNETYPHVYGPIPRRAVVSAMPIEPEVEVKAEDLAAMQVDDARRLLGED